MTAARKLSDLLPKNCARVVDRTFDFMGVAEDEIAAAMKGTKSLERKRRINGVFLALMPGPLIDLTEEVYRHHCRELIARAANEQDLYPGTTAEVLQMLEQTSLRSPLNRQGIALYERLFREVFGSLPEGREPTPEPWEGATDEMLRDARRRLRKARDGK